MDIIKTEIEILKIDLSIYKDYLQIIKTLIYLYTILDLPITEKDIMLLLKTIKQDVDKKIKEIKRLREIINKKR